MTGMTKWASLTALVLAGALATSGDAAQAPPANSIGASVITPSHLHSLLRNPNGLEKLSEEVGDVVLPETAERWGEADLPFLVRNSAVICQATVTQAVSYLTDQGSDIHTRYTLTVNRAVKGEAKGSFVLDGMGGSVELPNGKRATVLSAEWKTLKVGQSYLLFVNPAENGEFRLSQGIAGLLAVDQRLDQVSLADTNPEHAPGLRADLDHVSLATAIERIEREGK